MWGTLMLILILRVFPIAKAEEASQERQAYRNIYARNASGRGRQKDSAMSMKMGTTKSRRTDHEINTKKTTLWAMNVRLQSCERASKCSQNNATCGREFCYSLQMQFAIKTVGAVLFNTSGEEEMEGGVRDGG